MDKTKGEGNSLPKLIQSVFSYLKKLNWIAQFVEECQEFYEDGLKKPNTNIITSK